MNTQTIDKIVDELKDFPDEKISSLLDYMDFLKNRKKKVKKSKINIPNEETLQVFKDTDEGKNLNRYDTVDDFFKKKEKKRKRKGKRKEEQRK